MQKLNQSCNRQSKTHLLIIKKVIFVLKKGRQFEGLHFNISLKLMVSFISNRSDNSYSVIAISNLSREANEIGNFIKWNK